MNPNFYDNIKARRELFEKCFAIIHDQISKYRFGFADLLDTAKILIVLHRCIIELDNILAKKGDTA